MNSLINPDDEDVKNKINKNLDIFFELNEELKELIDYRFDREYMLEDFRKYLFKKIKYPYYKYPISINTTDNDKLNSAFIDITYELSKEKDNKYLEMFKIYLGETELKMNNELINNSIKQIKKDYEFINNSIKDNYELINNSIIDNSNNYRYIIRYIKDIKEENKILRFFLVINFSLLLVILNIFDLRI